MCKTKKIFNDKGTLERWINAHNVNEVKANLKIMFVCKYSNS